MPYYGHDAALTGDQVMWDYTAQVIKSIQSALLATNDKQLLNNTEEELTNYFLKEWRLDTVELDESRSITATQERELYNRSSDFRGGTPNQAEIIYAIIELPIVPKVSNKQALNIRGNNWPIYTTIDKPGAVRFREIDHCLIVKVISDKAEEAIDTIKRKLDSLNVDIKNQMPGLYQQVVEMVKSRKTQVTANNAQFERQMTAAGIVLKKRPNAIEPINVQVKREIRVLRDQSSQPSLNNDQVLDPSSLNKILDLIEQGGKGFEVAPATFKQLGEEGLRDILVGYLNAVFERDVATRETFSKNGKTDIYLILQEGIVLIAECKIWDGQKLYSQTLDQLFGYLTWRHTAGIMITFSFNKGLSRIIEEAKSAIKSHESFQGNLNILNPTKLSSDHEHPSDPQKSLILYHLFFDLHT